MIRMMAALRAALAATVWTAGLPIVLVAVGGSPIPASLPTAASVQAWLNNPLLPQYTPGTVKATAWAVWALTAVAIVAVGVQRTRRWQWARLVAYLPGPVQGLAATLLGAAAATTAVGASPAAHAAAPATTAVPAPGHLAMSTEVTLAADTRTRAPDRPPMHHVERGDTLWDIADDTLGDPHRWREIYTLNRGHHQANGYALTDPDEIHIGWDLALPTHDTPPARRPSTTPAHGASTPSNTTPAPHPSIIAPQPAPGTPEAATPSTTPATTAPTGPTASVATGEASPSAPATTTSDQPRPPASESTAPDHGANARQDADGGMTLPSQGWASLGLAALIAAVASLLRLQRRRHARLGFPIPARLEPQPTPVPASLAPVDNTRVRRMATNDEPHRPATPALAAPIGLDATGNEVSLFDLPGPGLALTGDGAESAARTVLAAALATGVNESLEARPVVVTTTDVLARLLPVGTPPVGLDPDQTSFDAERLIVLDDIAAAVTHAEEEMIMRRRLLDTFDLDSITALNARTDHAEAQSPYVVLVEATTRHAARLLAVGAHRAALQLHPVILGTLDGIPAAETAADGTVTDTHTAELARLSTLAAGDLAAVLSMLTDTAPRPEPGHDIDLDPAPIDAAASAETVPEPIPARATATPAPVRLRVLGPLMLDTPSGPVTTGMRSGSYTVLASLAVHPCGRTLEQLAADLHPDDEPKAAGNRIRTDISTLRKVLRTATGNTEAMFVNYDAASRRYSIDVDLIAVDLWQMLTAIHAANAATDDTTALAALRKAADLYAGDFADGNDHTWMNDHATNYRHQLLAVYARIAEILESDHPDQAIAALERALEFDPVNEELYQRIMRIHGRVGRPDVVRRTLRRLEERLADLGNAEPSEATRRVAERQLRLAATGSAGHR
ncbi:BTAD domain-containing putative transcriptional regulator [Nucisporomicrobium flavum]|uniref:BTAD domain-containing putative transcriptional regulator n=1 Tax=Nucisporomicrobium flavum TaxID=2785915 RepID=UPI003C2D6CAE